MVKDMQSCDLSMLGIQGVWPYWEYEPQRRPRGNHRAVGFRVQVDPKLKHFEGGWGGGGVVRVP